MPERGTESVLLTPEEAGGKKNCYYLKQDGETQPLLFHSPETDKVYALVPTVDWPSVTISGVRMHEASPKRSLSTRMRLLSPRGGNALDICTGLGYSAIGLARKAEHVTTIEADENVLRLARCNPYSKKLFDNPKITIVEGDALEEIKTLPSNNYASICVDPPRFPLASELYSLAFFQELLRVTARDGRVFVYTGEPFTRNRKKSFAKGVGSRLREAGFGRVSWSTDVKGFLAVKG
ncbi:MAG: hypothetical protein WC607_04340 [Candidatus Micrarchaeia archaeon]